ncbi:MAG: aspartate aminotransferase family protein [Actinomycetota bacterium]
MNLKTVSTEGSWELSDYPLWHGAAPMSLTTEFGGPAKVLVAGEGCWVEDAAGRRYLDARAGICNVNLGYGRSDVVKAMYEQASALPFACSIRYERLAKVTLEYARALVDAAPEGLTRVRLTHMGSASVEGALLMTRLFFKNDARANKRWIIALEGSFHGTTLMSMAASGEKQLHEIFGPMPEGFTHVAAPFPRETDRAMTIDENCDLALDLLRERIEALGQENVAGIILEPVMGTRVNPLPARYLQEVRRICDDNDILLIFDEIVTAFGRVGFFFAADHFGVTPDIMCLAKGITSGYATLGAVLVNERVFAGFDGEGRIHFPNGSSTDGHPIACAGAQAVLSAYKDEGVIDAGRRIGEMIMALLKKSLQDHPLVADIRGLGMYIGIEIRNPDGSLPNLATMRGIESECERRGVLIHYSSNLVILMPPLIMTKEEAETVVESISETLQELSLDAMSPRPPFS